MHVNNHRGRKINFKEKCLICWGIEVKLIKFQGFKGQTLRQKTFRKLRIFFLFGGGGFGEINALFLGRKGAQTLLEPQYCPVT